MAKIKIDAIALKGVQKELENGQRNMENQIKELNQVLGVLDSCWQGESKTNFDARVSGDNSYFSNYLKAHKETIKVLEESTKEYISTDNKVMAIVRNTLRNG